MLRPLLAVLLVTAGAAPLAAAQPARQAVQRDNPQIDYPGFRRLAAEVQPYRQTRLVDWAEFDRMRGQREVLILDARSETAFRQGHIAGAVNLPLPDFTAESLARVIGANRNRPILIYCNNNFSNNRAPVVTKMLPLALNIQTFINLVGYGYRNVRELNDVIDFTDPEVRWVQG
ncbi:MAG TPA: rhodanese-like domain-containing protein [Allosphingosinicella sp.]|nr:rhodanese-like domain-containing protein [Allosphingosinicella sp.]